MDGGYKPIAIFDNYDMAEIYCAENCKPNKLSKFDWPTIEEFEVNGERIKFSANDIGYLWVVSFAKDLRVISAEHCPAIRKKVDGKRLEPTKDIYGIYTVPICVSKDVPKGHVVDMAKHSLCKFIIEGLGFEKIDILTALECTEEDEQLF